MIGKLSAGSETAPKCFEGLFPPEIKPIAIGAPSMPGDAPDKIDRCLDLLREAGLNVKVMPHAREGEPGRTREDIIDVRKRAADLEQAWLDPEDLDGFAPIPVKLLDGLPVMTDGHTRAVAALMAGLFVFWFLRASFLPAEVLIAEGGGTELEPAVVITDSPFWFERK